MKILIIIGTRPEAIKMGLLIKKLKSIPSNEIKLCITGQHREMLDQVITLFEVSADYDLNIMKKNQTLSDITVQVISKLQPVIDDFKPEAVIVHGDTTTAAASALASFYNRIPVLHVEAGLRTWNVNSPWPEEANRRIISLVATKHFAPTESSRSNLKREGVADHSVIVTGNTVVDSLIKIKNEINNNLNSENDFRIRFPFLNSEKKLILITGHRRENLGGGFIEICNALKRIIEIRDDVQIIYPVHLNPIVRLTVDSMLRNIKNIFLIEPLDYFTFVQMMIKSYLIMTDSGGIQEEAPALGKPVLVLRENTERPEAVLAGTVKLVGTDVDLIVNTTLNLLDDEDEYLKMCNAKNPYGDGFASDRIISEIQKYSFL